MARFRTWADDGAIHILGSLFVGKSGSEFSFVLVRLELPMSGNQASGDMSGIHLELGSHKKIVFLTMVHGMDSCTRKQRKGSKSRCRDIRGSQRTSRACSLVSQREGGL